MASPIQQASLAVCVVVADCVAEAEGVVVGAVVVVFGGGGRCCDSITQTGPTAG